MKDKINYEVTRMKKFQRSLLGIKKDIQIEDVDVRNYAKFILKEGTIFEKREILGNLQGKIILKEKEIKLVL